MRRLLSRFPGSLGRILAMLVLLVSLVGASELSQTGSAGPAQAAVTSYIAILSGPAEASPNNSPGVGTAQVDYDPVAHTMRVRVSFSGLQGTTTASHIHACTPTPLTGAAGVATTTPTFAGFPLGVTSGTYDNTLDTTAASSYNPAFITANGGSAATAENQLAACLANGQTYLNVHSNIFPSGEIRGFL